MKTELTPAHLDSPRGQRANAILRSCVHCGFCNATCPTYQLLGDELDGPRGRIYQIKQVLEGMPATVELQTHLDRCLTCRACETTCPSGVDYHRLLDVGRELVEEQLPRPALQSLLRRALIFTLSEPQHARLLFATARFFRPLLPEFLKKKIPPLPSLPKVPQPVHARRMLLLDGCVQPATAPQINLAAQRAFSMLGIELVPVAQAGCCGALQHHLGDSAGGLARARNNIDAWWPSVEQGAEAIVITASGCAPMVKDYAELLAGDPVYAERAARVSELTKDVSEIVRQEDISKLPRGDGRRIAFHSPCTLQHGQKLNGVVEKILTRLGYQLVEVKDPHLCCGSAGTYSILQPGLSAQLRTNKLDALQENRPELIATANIGCLIHLQQDSEVAVRHWVELLAT
jgi:glycolate oxidase iron-sulfur subunit